MREGACRFGYWWVHVEWSGDLVYRVKFAKTGEESPVPGAIRRYLRGKGRDFEDLRSIAVADGHPYAAIYRCTAEIPYGETRTYAEIGAEAGFHARTVGSAMRRNPTSLIVPCHRVVSKNGIGGFTPDIRIKSSLLEMERKNSDIPFTGAD